MAVPQGGPCAAPGYARSAQNPRPNCVAELIGQIVDVVGIVPSMSFGSHSSVMAVVFAVALPLAVLGSS